MLFEISAVLVLVLLTIKEVAGESIFGRSRRLASLFYMVILPLLALFVIEAVTRIAQLPLPR